MTRPIEDQLRDYLTYVDHAQGAVDIPAISSRPQVRPAVETTSHHTELETFVPEQDPPTDATDRRRMTSSPPATSATSTAPALLADQLPFPPMVLTIGRDNQLELFSPDALDVQPADCPPELLPCSFWAAFSGGVANPGGWISAQAPVRLYLIPIGDHDPLAVVSRGHPSDEWDDFFESTVISTMEIGPDAPPAVAS